MVDGRSWPAAGLASAPPCVEESPSVPPAARLFQLPHLPPRSCSNWRSPSGRRSTCASRRRLVDDAAWSENEDADEFMLQPGSIDAITDFWNWINDGAGSGDVGLHGDFSSYDEWEEARGLVERGERELSDYGGELPATEPPEEWQRYCDWQRQFRTRGAS